MTTRVLKFEDIEEKKLRDIIDVVLKKKRVITVRMPNGDEIIIRKKPDLEPLPVLEGYVPEGWKEEINQ